MIATLTLPFSASELRDAVRHARPFNPARLDRVLRLDAARGLVEVQANASWQGLVAYLRPTRPELAAAWPWDVTVGESIATNAAGPDGRPVVVHLESLTLVTPDGELRRVSRANPELFALAVGGQGLFGALYSATLRLESLARAAAEATPPTTLALPRDNAADADARLLDLLVPPENHAAFLAEVRARCAEWRIDIEAVAVRRTLAENETVLCWARREYAAISLRLGSLSTLGGAVRSTQLRRSLIDSAIAHGGSFCIATTTDATRAQVEACYPELGRFLADKRRLDPAEKLTNAWYRHYRNLLGRQPCEGRWQR